MKLSKDTKNELFPSKKVHSDIADAYVEIGLKRIVEYYERTESDISFPELFEKSLIELEGYKNKLIIQDKPIPFELLWELDTKAREYTMQLDKQYMIFKNLIAQSELTPTKKRLADQYLEYLDISNQDRFEKYMMVITDIEYL